MRKYRAEQCCPCPVLFPPRFLANAVLASLNARASGVRSHDHAQAPKYPAGTLEKYYCVEVDALGGRICRRMPRSQRISRGPGLADRWSRVRVPWARHRNRNRRSSLASIRRLWRAGNDTRLTARVCAFQVCVGTA